MATRQDPEISRQASFEREAIPHHRAIHRTAARFLKNRGGADEVTQEVFLTAWKSFDRFRAGTNCRAWLYRILAFTVLHYRRHERRFPEASPCQTEALVAAPYINDRLTDRHLLQALGHLPEHYRRTLLLVDLQDHSYREAAQVMNVPVGTVMSRLNRARRRMRTLLADSTDTAR